MENDFCEDFEVLNYFEDSYQEYWRQQMLRTDWPDAKTLVKILEDGTFFEKFGENAKLLLLADGETLISYCVATSDGEVKFLFTFPSYRGKGCAKKLLESL